MSDEFDTPIENIPAVMISVDHQVTEGRIIRFSTGLPQSASPQEFNTLLDKLAAASDRQAAREALKRLESDLKREEKLYVQQQEDLARLDGEQRAAYEMTNKRASWSPDKLTGAQIKDRQNAEVSIKRREDGIRSLREMVAMNKAVLDAHGGANSH